MELMTKMSSIIAKKTEKKDNEKNTTTTTALGGKVDFQPKPDGNYSNSSMSGSPLTSGPASPSSSPSSLILTNTMSDVTNKKRQELINRVNQMTTTLQRKLSDVTSNMKSSNMSNQDLLRTLETLKNYTRTMRNNLIALSIETHQLNSEEIEISKLKQEVEEAKKELNKLNEELAQQLQEMYGN